MSEHLKRLWRDKEYQEMMSIVRDIKPNKPEQFFNKFLSKLFPDKYKYVGNFKFWLGNKNPDFIDEKEKRIIELFGDYWHSKKKTNRDESEEERIRIEHFGKYKYTTLIVWERELKDLEKLKNKIIKFNKK